MLADGDVIPMSATETPIEISQLIANLDSLAGSIPRRDLAVVLSETSTAVRGLGPTIGQLLDDSNRLTEVSLENIDDLTLLIDDASTVLDTQIEKGPQTTAYLANLASLTTRLLELNGTLEELFGNGIDATTQVTKLLQDNQETLPVLLTRLLTLTDVAAERTQGLRKTLTLFPWVLEVAATSVHHCDVYNAQTGKPVQSTCRYDEQGRPVYSAHLGLQLPENPGDSPYRPCTDGYQGTVRYLPNGQPMDGSRVQRGDSPLNSGVSCTASPTDPGSPNVRGAQNSHDYGPGRLR
jgi:phospholipid/cholesterol/gamma-HCH transport system substrate-binding protein